jgi:nucleoside-diphosphate-sugar epimerase
MNILITGAFGFVGSNLSKKLRESNAHRIIALDVTNALNNNFDEYFSWLQLEEINWSSIDAVIHLAGKAHDTTNTSDEKSYFDINFGLTKKIFDRFITSAASKFIFFSSVKAAADTVTGPFLTEEVVANPLTPYGRSKLQAEQYILEQVPSSEKQVYILRPSMIHGPGNKGNLNLLYKIAKKGYPWPLGSFENKRSFTSIQNLGFVITELIEKNIKPGIYQMADDEALSTNELIQMMSASMNKKTHIWHVPSGLIGFMAKVGDKTGLPLNSERLKKLTESYVVSNQKLKTALGIARMPRSAGEGMKETFASFI